MASSRLNPRTKHYEFLGPPGAFIVTVGVTFLSYALYFGCSETSGGCPPPLELIPQRLTASLSSPSFWLSLYSNNAMILYCVWYAYCVGAWLCLPGDWIEGTTLRTGEKKRYKINGMHTVLSQCQRFMTIRSSLHNLPPQLRLYRWSHLAVRHPVVYVHL